MIKTIKDIEDLPAMFPVKSLEEITGVSRAMAYNLAHSKGFPTIRIGKRILIPKQAFIKWIEENTVQAGV